MKERFLQIDRVFLFTVVIPTLIAIVYFGLIASDVYISESSFVVRSAERQAVTGLGSLLKSSGFSRSQDDSYSVQDFMLSRDALYKINQQVPLVSVFGDSKIDVFNRFNGFGLDGSNEALYRYYQNRIVMDLDSASSISTLRVSAYQAEDATRINEILLELAENLVNQLNERARQDTIRFAKAEVDVAEQKAKAAGLALSAYRNQKGIFDPGRQSAIQLQLISKLQDDLISTKTQLEQVRTFTPENPQVGALQKRVSTLQSEIDVQMTKITGDGALTSKTTDYERLSLEREFSEKQLFTALASLEQARSDALRQQLYLERIVQPNHPDQAIQPRRLRGILTTILLGLISWGVLSMLLAGIREHQD